MKNFNGNFSYDCSECLVFINKIGKDGVPGNIVYVNEEACCKLGYTKDEMTSLDTVNIGMPICEANLKDELSKLFAGETISYSMLFFTKFNKVILTNVEVSLCEFCGNSTVLTIAREINDKDFIRNIVINFNNELNSKMVQIEETKEQLFQHEKLAIIGQMAAGVAHEINNPLGYVSSNIETGWEYFSKIKKILYSYDSLISKLPSISPHELNDEIKSILDLRNQSNIDFIMNDIVELNSDIKNGLNKISEIVNNLKTFSRVDPTLKFEEYDLNKGIKETLNLAKNEIKYNADVVVNFCNIPIIMANGNRINEVILNIILNSCYAIKNKKSEENGLIIISTSIEDNYVVCQIEDNGIGIEIENLTRIFDPFFTTKPVGSGTGLGLSISYDIVVNKHNGKIYIESTFGKGTKTTIKLPALNNERNT